VRLTGTLSTNETAKVLYSLLLFLFSWYGFWGIVLFRGSTSHPPQLSAITFVEAVLAAALFMLRRGSFKGASWIYLGGIWLFATVVVAQNGGIRSALLALYVTLPVSAAWLLGYQESLRTAIACLVSALAFAAAETAGVSLPRTIPGTPIGLWVQLAGAVLMTTVPVARVLRALNEALAKAGESAQLFRDMADTAPVMIFVTAPDGSCTSVNRTWLNFTGRTLEEELGYGWTACVHPDDLQRNHEAFSAALQERRRFQTEARWRRADGEYRLVLCTGIPRFGPDGNFAGYIGSKIDITDLQSEERFRQLAENIDQVFWMLDIATLRVLYVSPAFEKVWGGSSAALYQNHRGLMNTVHPEDRDLYEAFFSKLQSEPAEETYRILLPDGSVRWIHDRAFLVYEAEDKPYRVAGIAEDVTVQRELEEALRQAYKMEAVGRLAGGIAHDFNNLLTVVGGYLHMVLDATPHSDPRHEKLQHILTASNRAATLTSQLLAFSRKQVIQPRAVNVNQLLINMEPLLRPAMGEHVQFATDLGRDLPCVKADPNQLEQVLMNLAANARDAMPTGGEFRIRTALSDGRGQAGSGRSIGRWVRIQISDTGCGMSQDVLAHVFEPFFTTKGIGKGTGLGLSSVYGIIQQNQGKIHVRSSPGRGTTFEILLPEAAGCEDTKQAASPVESPRGTETILVVEDELHVREMVCDMLKRLGYNVLQAADGRDALRALEQHSPIDVILTDVIMPVMGGPELAKRARSHAPDTKVIFMSGYATDTLRAYGLPQPDTEYIQKPFTLPALAEKLYQVLSDHGRRRESWVNPSSAAFPPGQNAAPR
jgi:PAS domain S-box-containing protein